METNKKKAIGLIIIGILIIASIGVIYYLDESGKNGDERDKKLGEKKYLPPYFANKSFLPVSDFSGGNACRYAILKRV